VHPDEWFQTKTKVGGTKALHLDEIRALQPDLIIANKEENEQAQIETLMQEFPVWISDIKTLNEAIDMIHCIGDITDTETKAKRIARSISVDFSRTPALTRIAQFSKKAVYLIWRNPYMTVNSDTFIHDMMGRCGLKNVFEHNDARYPEITIEEIAAAAPDIIFLSSEPYPFKEQHILEMKSDLQNIVSLEDKTRIILVDGEMFSWYGSRLIQAPDYFSKLIYSLQSI
jgi:ABC-type Fe3+-hydroxamate transport system substrate-binding protein